MTFGICALSRSIIAVSFRTTVSGPLHTCRFLSDWRIKHVAATTMSPADLSPENAGSTQDVHLTADSERNPGSRMQNISSNVWRYFISIIFVQLFDAFYPSCICVPKLMDV